MNFKDMAEQNETWIIEQRRYFHAHPELSFEEKKYDSGDWKTPGRNGSYTTFLPGLQRSLGNDRGWKKYT